MVIITQKSLNLELDKYLSSRKQTEKKPFDWSKLNVFSNFTFPELKLFNRVPKEVTEKEFEEDFAPKEFETEKIEDFDPLTGNIKSDNFESLEELNEEIEKKSIVKRIRSMFRREKIYSEDEIMGELITSSKSTIPDDIKEALRIQNNWLKRLSAARMKEFKESEDYELYKQILETHNLIRK